MEIIGFFIPLFILFDMGLTLYSIKLFKKYKRKNQDWTEAEANGLVVRLWKRFGLFKGTIFALIIQIGLWMILLFTLLNRDMIFFALGMYFMLFYFHVSNIIFFKQKRKELNQNE